MIYTTEHLLNLVTGMPFRLEVESEKVNRLTSRIEQINLQNRCNPTKIKSTAMMVTLFEFSLLPSHKLVCEIWVENGYTDELVTQILRDFGIADNFILRLLASDDFVSAVRPNFAGIIYNSSRASSLLFAVYKKTKSYFRL